MTTATAPVAVAVHAEHGVREQATTHPLDGCWLGCEASLKIGSSVIYITTLPTLEGKCAHRRVIVRVLLGMRHAHVLFTTAASCPRSAARAVTRVPERANDAHNLPVWCNLHSGAGARHSCPQGDRGW